MINTDQIIPSKYLKDLNADLSEGFLAFQGGRMDGTVITDIMLERPQFKHAPVLVAGANFGCGSSGEHAVWAMQVYGVRCVIGHQLAEFFMDNCLKNGVLPIELNVETHQRVMQAAIQADGHTPIHVDLGRLQITVPGVGVVAFPIDPQHHRINVSPRCRFKGKTLGRKRLIVNSIF